MTSKFEQSQVEPLFVATHARDPELSAAFALAAATMGDFRAHVQREGTHSCLAKLRFRDPVSSESQGEDRFLFLWLSSVVFHNQEGIYSGEFFEVPKELHEWHQADQRLGFESEDVFDWMVIEDGRLCGGFTVRVARSRLPEAERPAYDRYIGVQVYEPLAGTTPLPSS